VISPTRIRDLVGYALAVTLVTWLALRQWYGDLPPLSWFVPLSLLLLAIAETLAANQLRDRIRRRPGSLPVQPLVAARMFALAKASSVVGAFVLGIWAGLLLYAVPRLGQLAAAGGDTRTGIVGVVAALSLVAAALWLEFSCRAPAPPDGDRAARPDGSAES
jgi:sterol desaturase/sphingolipid hydroxylase (fatty acid hydroxylase superfamily)